MHRFRTLILGCAILLTLGGLTHSLLAYPEPELVNRAWEYDFTYETPRLISVQSADGKAHWYWYMTYKVVNNTDIERLLVTDIELATDDGLIRPAGQDVPSNVFDAVKKKVHNPLLESPIQVVGRLLLGEENARESVAIWPVTKQDIDEMNVFVAGLSGETQIIQHPVTGEDVMMRKTLMIKFNVPGNPPDVRDSTVVHEGQSWIMR